MLSCAFGQLLDFPFDIAKLTHIHLNTFPTKVSETGALSNPGGTPIMA